MLNSITASKTYRAISILKGSKLAKRSAPPIFIVPDVKATPHPVYGNVPIGRDGFTLQKQTIQILDHWHQKATEICYAFERSKTNQEEQWDAFEKVHAIQWDIFKAAKKAKVKTSRELAVQLRLISRHAVAQGELELEGCLNIKEFANIAERLCELTSPILPKKKPGQLAKGRTLTRAGLLSRYQSFLTQELEAVSWNLYGERDFAKQYTMYDSAVKKRCGSSKGRYPFFDERKLSTRAKTVLCSLKINATDVDSDDMRSIPTKRRTHRAQS